MLKTSRLFGQRTLAVPTSPLSPGVSQCRTEDLVFVRRAERDEAGRANPAGVVAGRAWYVSLHSSRLMTGHRQVGT